MNISSPYSLIISENLLFYTGNKTNMARPKYTYGWGNCAHCGFSVGATKTGRAVRHGFIRIKRHIKRLAFLDLASGHDHYACPGSGQPVEDWYRPSAQEEKKDDDT